MLWGYILWAKNVTVCPWIICSKRHHKLHLYFCNRMDTTWCGGCLSFIPFSYARQGVDNPNNVKLLYWPLTGTENIFKWLVCTRLSTVKSRASLSWLLRAVRFSSSGLWTESVVFSLLVDETFAFLRGKWNKGTDNAVTFCFVTYSGLSYGQLVVSFNVPFLSFLMPSFVRAGHPHYRIEE